MRLSIFKFRGIQFYHRKILFILLAFSILFFIVFLLQRYQCIFLHCRFCDDNYQVTKIIHQSWKNRDIPKDFKRYQPSWMKCFPYWEHKFWTDEDNRKLVEQHYPWFLNIYDSFPGNIYRADVSRYFYLYHYGGIYTDMDNECLFPFEHLLTNFTFVFGTIDNVNRRTPLPENYVQNSFMYSKPKQQFWLDLIKSIKFHTVYPDPDLATGPKILCDMIHKFRNRFPNNHRMKIYDAWYFNPISWGGIIKYANCKPLGRMSNDEWIKCREQFRKNGSYVLQYHSHMWG